MPPPFATEWMTGIFAAIFPQATLCSTISSSDLQLPMCNVGSTCMYEESPAVDRAPTKIALERLHPMSLKRAQSEGAPALFFYLVVRDQGAAGCFDCAPALVDSSSLVERAMLISLLLWLLTGEKGRGRGGPGHFRGRSPSAESGGLCGPLCGQREVR